METITKSQLINRLGQLRRIQDLSLTDVTKALNLGEPYMSHLETGKIGDPRFFRIQEIINYLGMSLEDFIDEDKYKNHIIELMSKCTNNNAIKEDN